ncbi:hypothetical protein C8A05DRAFT_36426 [Staphylotrichum tortipilum]|uniref:Uncharacterized protein n=1 Tax=Staphylotrichum tortipilum TaxID=2831512 RepID=A0AAN6MG58_9PEZI|nr:hypothetical protein C8A05DRAFT_36426 [Staphylotrichum longicolle]
MAGFYLVPIHLAVPLAVLILALTPLTPLACAWLACTTLARGVRQRDASVQTAKTLLRQVLLAIILPWAALALLTAMIFTQLLLTPLSLAFHLRNLEHTLTRLSTRLPASPPPPFPADLSTLPKYTFAPLPPPEATATPTIRLLTLHPSHTRTSPLCGTISTVELTSSLDYDALSYSWRAADDEEEMDSLMVLDARKRTWSVLEVTGGCAAGLRRVRRRAGERRVKGGVNGGSGVEQERGTVGAAENKGVEGMKEKGRMVELVGRIFEGARRVVVYTGEGDKEVEGLFKWVGALGERELKGRERGLLGRSSRDRGEWWSGWGKGEEIERVWNSWGKRAWEALRDGWGIEGLGLGVERPVEQPGDLQPALRAFFGRRIFGRVWPLQEMLLPEPERVRFICGRSVVGGEMVMHLATLLDKSKWLETGARFGSLLWAAPEGGLKRSHLLEVLLETQHRQCQDPRDKIYGVLALVERLDGGARMSKVKVGYDKSLAEIYSAYSAQFIRWHGPGFFLSLVKSPPNLKDLPSWSADWTVQWPNQRALGGRTYSARSRTGDGKDSVMGFEVEEKTGRVVMNIMRPRIVRGFYTRTGHFDSDERIRIENVRQLGRDETLVEMYPGLALLLQQVRGDPEHFIFVQTCPHAPSRQGVERVVANWSQVVVEQDEMGLQGDDGTLVRAYLSLPRVYKIV